jgi:alkylglycerol monooxygenase
LCLIGTALFLFNAGAYSLGEKAIISLLICIVVVNSGVLFEQRSWARYSEWIRIVVYPALLMVISFLNEWSAWFYVLGISYFVISSIWFYAVQKKYDQVRLA